MCLIPSKTCALYIICIVCIFSRRIEHLESTIAAERESPATLPITEGSRASSHSSLDGIVTNSYTNTTNSVVATLVPVTTNSSAYHHHQQPQLHSTMHSDEEVCSYCDAQFIHSQYNYNVDLCSTIQDVCLFGIACALYMCQILVCSESFNVSLGGF